MEKVANRQDKIKIRGQGAGRAGLPDLPVHRGNHRIPGATVLENGSLNPRYRKTGGKPGRERSHPAGGLCTDDHPRRKVKILGF
ncbi:MAG: hypothetical protein JXA82_18685 [Sedimentisphaerales bacterium]|nr:hypothetical protein [Sedimentisphaerales bacterium]